MPGLFSGCLAIPSIVPKFVWLGTDVHAHADDLFRITRADDRGVLSHVNYVNFVKLRGTREFMKRFIISMLHYILSPPCIYIYV